ncbi:MAG: DUF599 family protein [Rhodospirillum sp.]|nr:DUF599 family protein [Rhodospirillum sp.]MCF8488337.1 DUF599 family protein [Rhodospirillum sp.]MCF8500758.1 DUF599 family protein [Rhodospirillum sp.]
MAPLDGLSLGWFALAWVGYTILADHSPYGSRGITAAMNQRRRDWMVQAAGRQLRIVDTNILGNLLTGIGFFSSTTIFVLGGLVAMLGVAEEGALAVQRIPLATPIPPAAWEGKILLLLGIFIYAFFKFAWAFRLANYTSISVGALPVPEEAGSDRAKRMIESAATLSALSAHHFNRGLRAYFFALAALGWLVSPVLFMGLTAGVTLVLHRREFRSRAVRAIREADGSQDTL